MAARPRKPPRAYGGIGISIAGMPEVQAMLNRLDDPFMRPVLQRATDAGAVALKPLIFAEMPPDAAHRDMRGRKRLAASGGLRQSVWIHRAKRQRPATIISNHRKIAYWWPMVIGGSRPHRVRFASQVAAGVPRSNLKSGQLGEGAIQSRGHGGNPFVSRALAKGQGAAMRAIEQVITTYLDSL